MATFYLSLSAKKDATNKQEVLIRFVHGKKINQRAKTSVFIPASYTDDSGRPKAIWDTQAEQIIIPNFRLMTDEKTELKQYLTSCKAELTSLITSLQNSFNDLIDKNEIKPNWLKEGVDKYYLRVKEEEIEVQEKQTFFELFDEFLSKKKLSEVRTRNFQVVKRALQRYELYKARVRKPITLSLDDITADTLRDIEEFMRNEHKLYEKYPKIYESIPEKRTPQPRGQNTINDVFTKIRTFFLWAINEEKTTNNPFKHYSVEECVYGTPYYISIEERNQLYEADLSRRPPLAVQRDIFVFQCLIGCRVGDLYKMTKANIIANAIEYVPRKTKEGRPVTVRVPLNAIAQEILSRYPDCEKLLPFISEQKYNASIKDAFRLAGLTRMVTIINPTTREEEKKPLNELASSHLARRCFVGNLYKQVKDPNLVGSLSGHKEGSKAFARYREIDEDMKKDLVNMLM